MALFFSPSSSLGGAEQVLLSLLRPWAFGELGRKPSVVRIENGILDNELASIQIESTLWEMPFIIRKLGDSPARMEGKYAKFFQLASSIPSLLRLVLVWKKRLSQCSPVWIHSNGFKTHILSAWSAPRDTPIFWHLHDFVGERPMMRRLLKLAWRPGIQALAISKAVAEDFLKHLPDCPVRIWYNTVDGNKFQPLEVDGDWLDRESGLADGFQGLRVGLVATYARWKGHDVFLRACDLLSAKFKNSVRFYLIGGPVYQTAGSQWTVAELNNIIRTLKLEDFVGLVPFQKDTSRVYQSLDVVVHASTRPEPFGLVITEAMACGKSVVAALHGGAAEIGEDGVHYVGHEPGNPSSLAAVVEVLIRDVTRRKELGIRARDRVMAKFGSEIIMQNWQELLGEVGIN